MLADSDIQEIEDLEGKTIGGVAGSHKVDIMTQYIEDKSLDIEIRTYENREGPELDFEKGQIDAYAQDYTIIQASIQLKNKSFRTLGAAERLPWLVAMYERWGFVEFDRKRLSNKKHITVYLQKTLYNSPYLENRIVPDIGNKNEKDLQKGRE
uniref:ABC transporter substrate-binding protein n=1 Tax=Aerococcus urinaeequi TaxID=51665 RepID=UPI00352A2260